MSEQAFTAKKIIETNPSRPETMAHIRRVQSLLEDVIDNLQQRQLAHDMSKLESPEVEVFDQYTPLLKTLEYNSPEYNRCKAEMKVGLDHHYAHNDHHPEFFGDKGVHGMSLIQLIEMLVDWKAAGERHGGCIFKSIEVNAKRFSYSNELKNILFNTARHLGYQPAPLEPDEVYVDGTRIPSDDYHNLMNAVMFNRYILAHTPVRLVFHAMGIDHTFTPDAVFNTVKFNEVVPEPFRVGGS